MHPLRIYGEDMTVTLEPAETSMRLMLEDGDSMLVALFDKEEAVQMRDKLNEYLKEE